MWLDEAVGPLNFEWPTDPSPKQLYTAMDPVSIILIIVIAYNLAAICYLSCLPYTGPTYDLHCHAVLQDIPQNMLVPDNHKWVINCAGDNETYYTERVFAFLGRLCLHIDRYEFDVCMELIPKHDKSSKMSKILFIIPEPKRMFYFHSKFSCFRYTDTHFDKPT